MGIIEKSKNNSLEPDLFKILDLIRLSHLIDIVISFSVCRQSFIILLVYYHLL